MVTTNVADYEAILLYSPEEFDVSECYERSNFDWSYVLLIFPTNGEKIIHDNIITVFISLNILCIYSISI